MPARVITPGVPVPGAPPPKLGGPVISVFDTTDYTLGRQIQAQGKTLPASASWWQREGAAEAAAGAPVLVLVVGAATPSGQRYAPLIASDVASYEEGYAANPASSPDNADYFWRWGFRDRAAGIPKAVLTVGQPPLSLPPPPAPPAPPPPPGRSPFIELAVDVFGHPVLYTTAVNISQLGEGSFINVIVRALEHWELLGDGPGDARNGYGLSGPNGAIARKVARGVATGELNPDPRAYGLPVWVGTAVQAGQGRGVRLLGSDELAAIGLLDKVWDRFGP